MSAKGPPRANIASGIQALAGLSETAIEELFDLYKVWLRSGEASLINAYGSQIGTADFLHSMGLMTDKAYNNIGLVSGLFSGVGIFGGIIGSLFGNNALQPVLKSRVEQNSKGGDNGEEEDPAENALRVASTQALAAAVQAALAAA